MRPEQRDEKGSGDLFRARLDQIIDMKHELVQLADEIDWVWIDDQVAESFSAAGRPGTLHNAGTSCLAFSGSHVRESVLSATGVAKKADQRCMNR